MGILNQTDKQVYYNLQRKTDQHFRLSACGSLAAIPQPRSHTWLSFSNKHPSRWSSHHCVNLEEQSKPACGCNSRENLFSCFVLHIKRNCSNRPSCLSEFHVSLGCCFALLAPLTASVALRFFILPSSLGLCSCSPVNACWLAVRHHARHTHLQLILSHAPPFILYRFQTEILPLPSKLLNWGKGSEINAVSS